MNDTDLCPFPFVEDNKSGAIFLMMDCFSEGHVSVFGNDSINATVRVRAVRIDLRYG
jgi:hypothetical protein